MIPTSWTDFNMDWNNPDPYNINYYLALHQALLERIRAISTATTFVGNLHGYNISSGNTLYDNFLSVGSGSTCKSSFYFGFIYALKYLYGCYLDLDFDGYNDNTNPYYIHPRRIADWPVEQPYPIRLIGFHDFDHVCSYDQNGYINADRCILFLKSSYNLLNRMQYCPLRFGYLTIHSREGANATIELNDGSFNDALYEASMASGYLSTQTFFTNYYNPFFSGRNGSSGSATPTTWYAVLYQKKYTYHDKHPEDFKPDVYLMIYTTLNSLVDGISRFDNDLGLAEGKNMIQISDGYTFGNTDIGHYLVPDTPIPVSGGSPTNFRGCYYTGLIMCDWFTDTGFKFKPEL